MYKVILLVVILALSTGCLSGPGSSKELYDKKLLWDGILAAEPGEDVFACVYYPGPYLELKYGGHKGFLNYTPMGHYSFERKKLSVAMPIVQGDKGGFHRQIICPYINNVEGESTALVNVTFYSGKVVGSPSDNLDYWRYRLSSPQIQPLPEVMETTILINETFFLDPGERIEKCSDLRMAESDYFTIRSRPVEGDFMWPTYGFRGGIPDYIKERAPLDSIWIAYLFGPKKPIMQGSIYELDGKLCLKLQNPENHKRTGLEVEAVLFKRG